MKTNRYFRTIALLLACLLTIGLIGCQHSAAPAPSTEEATEPTMPETTVPETTVPKETDSEPTSLTEEPFLEQPYFEVFRSPEEIQPYPFTQQEIDEAVEVVQMFLEKVSQEVGVLTYEVECIAYDPLLTDANVRQRMSGIPVDGWTEEDYLMRQISFTVFHSATYNHEKTFMQDRSHAVIEVSLLREDSQSPWEFYSNSAPSENIGIYGKPILTDNELAEIAESGEHVLAGYADADGYWLCIRDDSASTDQFVFRAT